MPRTINTIAITIARDSLESKQLAKYIDRLLTECYELPGVVLETEIDVNPGDTTTYAGCIDGKMSEPEALQDELRELAEEVLLDFKPGA